MALTTSSVLLPLVLVLVLALHNAVVDAQVEESSLKLMNEWPTTTSLYSSDPFGFESDEEGDESESESESDATAITNSPRRSLFWYRMRYYISYGALSANRIPCPPRSGRSYYTHNCYHARGPVHPYHRGCSAITRCRR